MPDAAPAEPEWMRCEHWWVYASQPDMPVSVGTCGLCGHLNGEDLTRQINGLLADRDTEIERLKQLADSARLLAPARRLLDQVAYLRLDNVLAPQCADMAQRIVDLIGHPVTDEPPHALVERDDAVARAAAAEAEVQRLRGVIAEVEALHFTRGRNILGQPVCNECSPLQPVPCPTMAALSSSAGTAEQETST